MAKSPGAAADRVATEVQQRVERLATLAADAILRSIYAPQVVSPPLEQSLDYWEPFFFTPDGYVNQPGRDRVFQQVGGAEYKKIAQDLARRIRKEGREATEETPGTPARAPVEAVPGVAAAPAPAAEPPVPPVQGGSPALPSLYGPRTQPEEVA